MKLICEALNAGHDRKQFDCGVEVLNTYLNRFASQDIRRKAAAVFVMVLQDHPSRVVGYYTLCATSIELTGLPDESAKRMARYPDVPGILIGRLARDNDFPGTGSLLLADALKRCVRSADEIAASVIVVDAKDSAAVAFYSKFGFQSLPRIKSRLFLPVKTAAKLKL